MNPGQLAPKPMLLNSEHLASPKSLLTSNGITNPDPHWQRIQHPLTLNQKVFHTHKLKALISTTTAKLSLWKEQVGQVLGTEQRQWNEKQEKYFWSEPEAAKLRGKK